MHTQSLIDEFLKLKRFAMIGVSRNPKDFSRGLFKEFVTRGYDVVPVNPFVTEVDGKRCYARITEIVPRVSAAIIMTTTAQSEFLIQECADAGITLVWLYGIAGEKSVNPNAVRNCQNLGINVIPGYCPFMVMPASSLGHRLHGSIWKLLGLYPK